MITFSRFETALQDALLHLNDPTYHPDDVLCAVLNVDTADALRSVVVGAIQLIAPSEQNASPRLQRVHDILSLRFVQEHPQKETARQLGITPRHLRREQQRAVQVLAERLWPHGASRLAAAETRVTAEVVTTPDGTEAGHTTAPTWQGQLQQEVEVLQSRTATVVADVAHVIDEVIARLQRLPLYRHAQVVAEHIAPALTTTLHRTVLSQVLLTAVEKQAALNDRPHIVIRADHWLRWTRIVISGRDDEGELLPESEFITEILAAYGGLATARRHGAVVDLELLVPSNDNVVVLTVDDNLDLVHFYRRYLEGSRYRIVHVSEGQQVFSAIDQIRPDVILLDVMLPDMSGWDLLHELHHRPQSAQIPVVVCSVVRQEALARSLGASGYLIKPVRRQSLLQTLDAALPHHM